MSENNGIWVGEEVNDRKKFIQGNTWNGEKVFGKAVSITYSFPDYSYNKKTIDYQKYNAGEQYSKLSQFSDEQKNVVKKILGYLSDVANITFTHVENEIPSSIDGREKPHIFFGNYDYDEFKLGYAYHPNLSSNESYVWINSGNPGNRELEKHGLGQLTLLHEIFHALGLSHNTNYTPEIHSVMAPSPRNKSEGYSDYYFSTPLIDDITSIQYLYGANDNAYIGNTVYGFHSNTGCDPFTLRNSREKIVCTVLDMGGNDTFDFSGYSQNQKINLNQLQFSNVGGLTANVSIAAGVIIENAIGGSGNDVIIGNHVSNILIGGDGDDTIIGAGGSNYLFGGGGKNIFVFNAMSNSPLTVPSKILDFKPNIDKIDLSLFNQGEDGIHFTHDVNNLNSGTTVVYHNNENDTLVSVYVNQQFLFHLEVTGQQLKETDFIIGSSGEGNIHSRTARHAVLNRNLAENTPFHADEYPIIDGDDENNTLDGTDIDNIIYGRAGNDDINGQSGNDYIYGGHGNDRIHGGLGNDKIKGDAGNDIIDGGPGDDIIYGDNGDDIINGGDGNDILIGGAGTDQLSGGKGKDIFIFNEISDAPLQAPSRITDFQSGIDKIDFSAFERHDRSINFTDNDSDLSNETTVVSRYDTDRRINYLSVYINKQFCFRLEVAGQPLQITDFTANKIDGTSGDDVISGTTKRDIINGKAGNDRISGSHGQDTISGGHGDDWIDGQTGDDELHGNAGNDTIFGGNGNDKIKGGIGDDNIYGDNGNDRIKGGAGQDILYGNDGDDTLYGNDGDDTLYGNDGDDTLYGGVGDDRLEGGMSNDKIWGGAGGDRLYGGAGDDVIYGGSGIDSILGGAGDDHLYGGAGDDYIWGNKGHDRIFGNAGDDRIEGGAGNDVIYGGLGIDNILGGTGNDHLYGGAGGDRIWGNEGRDRIFGNAGDDWIDGGAGDDWLVGGSGADVFIGGEGHDIFRFEKMGDSSPNAPDMILDFECGIDKIDLSKLNPEGRGIAFVDRVDNTSEQIAITYRYEQAREITSMSAYFGEGSELKVEFVGQPLLQETDFIF